jgi:uncharacterized protein with GYD domain
MSGHPGRTNNFGLEVDMGKYLFQATYTSEGAKGLARVGGSARRASIEKTIAGLGGKLECFYYAFGDVDSYAIADLPDHESAAAFALAVNQGGAASVKTIVLMTVKQVDKAVKKTVGYKAPGR